ncbi:MAG: histidine kinase dimerization/phospho-acceptor domain-containing protein [Candidatus Nitrosopolaris sp.]
MREHKIGIMHLFKELSALPEEGGAISIRILTPTNDTIDRRIEEMKTSTTTTSKTIVPLSSDNYNSPRLEIRRLESQPEFNITTVTIMVVDRKTSLAIEKVDDSKESFIEAVGLSTYPTSQPTVISYLSIFENFWNQFELYEKLKEHDKLQQEFINIAAHELRTPAQSILGYAELAMIDPPIEIKSFIDAMYRNAFRIQKLTKDILDVTRIESHTLRLNKIKFDLKEIILNVIEDTELKLVPEDRKKVKLEFKNMVKAGELVSHSEDIFVQADRATLTY